MIKALQIIILLFCLSASAVYSQSAENAGWVFISHSQELSKKWEALADVQVRSDYKLIHFETLLLRGGLGYKFTKAQSAAIGYAYKGDWTPEGGKMRYSLESRIYEQYMYTTNIKRTQLTLRLRQEQRFVKQTTNYAFSQRSRAFLSFQIPLIANMNFDKGLYTTLQDEIFVNMQHKENVNNDFFDQNRPFISVGYRWNKKIDTEIGYMRWLQLEFERNTSTNVFQLMITTSF